MPTIISLCQEANTPLVLFPAHNEGSALWKSAAEQNGLDVLPWQAEINALIEEGLATYRDFCVEDIHNHSTALAGYVGATMIYRAVCGELPPQSFYGAPLHADNIRSFLSVYMDRGYAKGVFAPPSYVLQKEKAPY